jgi:hypothetical protein
LDYILIFTKFEEDFVKFSRLVGILSKLEVLSIKPERWFEQMLFLQSLIEVLCKLTWVRVGLPNFDNVRGLFQIIKPRGPSEPSTSN